MPVFGVVAEGITDQKVIENVLHGFFQDSEEELMVAYTQPVQDVTAKKGAPPPPGGWSLVFKFFEAGEHRRALQTYDYLVVHVDTDVSEQAGYDVPHRDGGRDLTVPELIARVVAKIKTLIGADFLMKYEQRFIFAIAVDGIECWLLPLLYKDNRAGKITGCQKAAAEALRKQDKETLSRVDRKDPRAYDSVSRAYLKRGTLMSKGRKNASLAAFLQNLEATGALAPPAASIPEADE